eukprot:11533120-Ditylum_brightwellii.AAC.1
MDVESITEIDQHICIFLHHKNWHINAGQQQHRMKAMKKVLEPYVKHENNDEYDSVKHVIYSLYNRVKHVFVSRKPLSGL